MKSEHVSLVVQTCRVGRTSVTKLSSNDSLRTMAKLQPVNVPSSVAFSLSAMAGNTLRNAVVRDERSEIM